MNSILFQELIGRQRVLVVGPPACGKTQRIWAVAKKAGYRLVVLRAGLAERVDLGGCLVPDMKAGVTRSLPLDLLHDLRTTKEQTLLFLDDMGQAPMDVQASIKRLFDASELSPEVLVWGATNRPGDKAGVSGLCEYLRSEFHAAYSIPTPGFEDKPDGSVPLGTWTDEVDGWCDWAESVNANSAIVAWHKATGGRTLYTWKPHADPAIRMPDYRTWGAVVDRWAKGLRSFTMTAAVLGKAVAAEFLAFAEMEKHMPSPLKVWSDPMGQPVPTEPSAQWLIATILAAKVEVTVVGAFIQYMERLPRVMTAYAGISAYKRLGSALSRSKEWGKFYSANQDLFGGIQ